MKLERALFVIALLAGASGAWAASNLNLSKSNVNRDFPRAAIFTASTDLDASQPQVVYTTPDSSDALLTQVCVGAAAGGVLVRAGSASIAHIAAGQCQTFTPAVVLPRGAALTCTAAAAAEATFCMISGVVGSDAKQGPTPSTETQ